MIGFWPESASRPCHQDDDTQGRRGLHLLLAIALFGRTVSLIFDGVGPTAFPPMIVEAVFIGLIVAAQREFARAK